MGGLCLVLMLASWSLVECAGVEYGVKSLPLQQGQCPSPQERERVREEITAEVKAILSGGAVHSCNGSPGWRRVGFVNMTDQSQDCPPGLSLTSHSIRTCGSSHHSLESCSSTTFSVVTERGRTLTNCYSICSFKICLQHQVDT
jgi:hypothetical protein